MIAQLRTILILGLFLVSPWIFHPFLYHPTSNLTLKQTVIDCVLLVVLALWVYDRHRPPVKRGAIQLGMVLYLAAAGLSWIVSDEPQTSGLRLTWLLLLVAFACTLGDGLSLFRRLCWVVLILSATLSMCMVLQYVGVDVLNFKKYTFDTAAVTLTHRNILASVLIWTVPFVIYLWLTAPQTFRVAAISSVLHVVLLAILLTHTRGSWIALAAALILMSVLSILFVERGLLRTAVRSAKLWHGLVIVALLPVSLHLINQVAPVSVGERIQKLVDVKDPNVQFRLATWKSGLDNFRDHPVLGSGVGTFKSAYMKYQGRHIHTGERFEELSAYAHNDYVEILSDTGLAGLLAFLILIGAVFVQSFRFLRRAADRDSKLILIVFLTAATTVLIHSLTHYGFHEPVASLFLWGSIGWIGGMTSAPPFWIPTGSVRLPTDISKRAGRPTGGLLVLQMVMPILVLAGAHFVIAPLNSEFCVEDGMAEFMKQMGRKDPAAADYAEAVRLADQAVLYDSANPFAYYLKGNALNKWNKKEEAIREYGRALRLRPHNPYFLSNRGITYFEIGHIDPALADLNRALELHPNLSIAYVHRAEIHLMFGRVEEAIRDWEQAIALKDRESEKLKKRIEQIRGKKP